ncbi:F-box/LRR-repeat protein 25 [Striga hermonthica]|uniref:F-box/LRR-repeat protein 25 n=1 Tax=Striga hermonthica TaxID=68872 RepID=A0A9N7NWC4_STRHE|nr:F-box/LRR-repeat protein 25 [Striga hermonthica]
MLNLGVKRFHLKSFSDCFDMPSVLFEAESLEELHLAHCRITYPDKLLSKKLRILSLVLVDIGDEALRKIMSGCPLMERVVLHGCQGLTSIKAHNSNLKHFQYIDTQGDNVLIDIDAPSLESIIIIGQSRWLYLGKSFMHLKFVYLEYLVLNQKFFDMCSVDLCCLEDLKMHSCSGLEEFQLSSRSIKRLRFSVGSPTKAVLDLPNILFLQLDCIVFPSISLSTDSSEWRSEIHLMRPLIPNNDNEAASLFDELHELHRALGHSRISMHMRVFNLDLAFSHEGLGELPVIESLTVEKDFTLFYLKAFFNYFFGKFRPRYVEQSVYAVRLYAVFEIKEYEEEPDPYDEEEFEPPRTVSATKKYGGVNELVDRLCDMFLMESERENHYWRQDLEEVSVEASEESGKKWRPLQGANISEWGLPNNVDQQIRFRLKWRGSSLS